MKWENRGLFLICSLIWGTTWLVIKFQIENVSPIVGVFYRFLTASTFMFLFNFFITKKPLKYPLKNHMFFLLQGFFNFSVNYILTYMAEQHISSYMAALTSTILIYFNMLGLWFWFKIPVSKNVFLGGILGIIGIFFLFAKDILLPSSHNFFGISLVVIATFFASTGNMLALKNHFLKVPIVIFNAYGMMYGAFFSLIIGLMKHESFHFPTNQSFILSLLYLSIFGSVITFWAYHSLAINIGADRAAYIAVITPMIAVVVSSFFENIKITPFIIIGIILSLLGNIISLKKDFKNQPR